MPWPTARSAVPMAAVVLPFPGPVLTMIKPRRTSVIVDESRLYLFARPSVPQVIRMPLQNGERPVNLLQQDHPRQLMRQGHFAQRQHQSRSPPGFFTETIRRTDGKQKRRRTTLL